MLNNTYKTKMNHQPRISDCGGAKPRAWTINPKKAIDPRIVAVGPGPPKSLNHPQAHGGNGYRNHQ